MSGHGMIVRKRYCTRTVKKHGVARLGVWRQSVTPSDCLRVTVIVQVVALGGTWHMRESIPGVRPISCCVQATASGAVGVKRIADAPARARAPFWTAIWIAYARATSAPPTRRKVISGSASAISTIDCPRSARKNERSCFMWTSSCRLVALSQHPPEVALRYYLARGRDLVGGGHRCA